MLTQLKITVRKKESWKRTLILKRVTRVHIFFLDCSTISNNSENDDIFIERTTRPRSTPQPLATTTKSFSHNWRLLGISCFQKVRSTWTGSSCPMSHFQTLPPLPVHLKKGNTRYILCTIRGGRERGKSYELFGKDSSPPSIVWQ